MIRILIAFALGLAATPAFAIDFVPSDNGFTEFDMPSRNICCAYNPDGPGGPTLTCTRVQPKYWIVELHNSGMMTVIKNPGEVPGCGYGEPLGNIFRYGTSWKDGGISCKSRTTGLECRANGAGFKLNRAGLRQFE